MSVHIYILAQLSTIVYKLQMDARQGFPIFFAQQLGCQSRENRVSVRSNVAAKLFFRKFRPQRHGLTGRDLSDRAGRGKGRGGASPDRTHVPSGRRAQGIMRRHIFTDHAPTLNG